MSLAPVEINLSHSATIIVSMFLERFAAAVSASRAQRAAAAGTSGRISGHVPEIRLLSEAGGMSIQGLITESYIRNSIRVPSSLSQMLPKLQFVCPRVRDQNFQTFFF